MGWRRTMALCLAGALAGSTGAGCSRAAPAVRADSEELGAAAHEDAPVGLAAGEVPAAEPPGASDPAPAEPPAAAQEAAAPVAEEPADAADRRVVYGLAAHPERAELRHAGATVVDLGLRGGARYTLGGFHTGAASTTTEGDSAVQRIAGGRLLLQVPSDVEGAGVLTVRGRGGRAAVHVGGRSAGTLELPADRLGVATLALRSGLRRGDVAVQLRFTAADARVDWLRVGPPEDGGGDLPPPAPERLVRRDEAGEWLRLPAGWTVGWHLDVPEGARLEGRVVGPAGGSVEVVAHADGREPLALGAVQASPRGAPLRLDLGALAGRVARLDLRASGAASEAGVQVLRPRVTAPRAGAAPAVERPAPMQNAIVVLVDTLRADRLSVINPRTRVRTPGIDAFARGAAVLLAAHAQECWTKPSVATLLSSWMPWQHGAVRTSSRFPDDAPMMQETLRRAGFHTEALVANGYVGDRFGFNRGWHFWRNYVAESRRNRADAVVHDVLARLDRRDPSRRFFYYVHTIDPHVPYTPPSRFVRMYDPEAYSGVVRWDTADFLDRVKLGQIALGARDRRHLEAQYDGEITFGDVHLAALLEGLERRGLAGNTMVVLTADHGEEFWEHGNVGHGHSVFEELVHVPLVVRAPGLVPSGLRSTSPAGVVDIAPTVLDALGVEAPDGLAGRSLIPALRGEDESSPYVTIAGFMDDRRAASAGRWKLILRGTRTDLFDVQEDPRETTDVSEQNPVALRYMRELLGLALAATDGGASRAARRRARPRQDVTIDAETERQLRELGYIPETRR